MLNNVDNIKQLEVFFFVSCSFLFICLLVDCLLLVECLQ